MAKYDGSGDISYTVAELREIAALLEEAAVKAEKDGGMYAISQGITGGVTVIVNVRPARFRGPVQELGFEARKFGTSLL